MTSKERVIKAIEFSCPDRIPYNFDSNRTPAIPEKYGDDFEWVFVNQYQHAAESASGRKSWETEWGIVYETIHTELGEAVDFPLSDISKVYEYQIPDFTKEERYAELEKAVNQNEEKYILGMLPHFLFLQMLDLVGFENLMYEFIDSPDEIEYLIAELTGSCLRVVDCMHDRGVDGMIAIEDLGVQDRLIISPVLWRQIFKPAYKKIIEKLHQYGMHFFIHSCGYIMDLIEDFIEIGVDVVQIDQQDNMGIENLSEKYRGRICFFCPCDIQTILPDGSKEQIEESVQKLIHLLGSEKGGFMAKTYPQPESICLPEESVKYMCELFKRHGAGEEGIKVERKL